MPWTHLTRLFGGWPSILWVLNLPNYGVKFGFGSNGEYIHTSKQVTSRNRPQTHGELAALSRNTFGTPNWTGSICGRFLVTGGVSDVCVFSYSTNTYKYLWVAIWTHLNNVRKSNWIISLGIEVNIKKNNFGNHYRKDISSTSTKSPSTVLVPKNPKKRMGEKRPTWLKSFDIDLGQFLLLLGVPGISRMQWSGVKKYSEPKFHALWGGKIPESCLHICIVIPSRWRANLRIPDDSAMFVFFNVGIFSCLFVGHEGIRDFLWSWPRLVPLHWGVLLLRCLLHPGKWTAGTQQRRFGSNDVPFKFRDFNALVVDPTHLKHMLVKLDRLPR